MSCNTVVLCSSFVYIIISSPIEQLLFNPNPRLIRGFFSDSFFFCRVRCESNLVRFVYLKCAAMFERMLCVCVQREQLAEGMSTEGDVMDASRAPVTDELTGVHRGPRRDAIYEAEKTARRRAPRRTCSCRASRDPARSSAAGLPSAGLPSAARRLPQNTQSTPYFTALRCSFTFMVS